MDYIDLYLIHWPLSSKPGIHEYPIKKEDFIPMDFKSVWVAMEECHKLGLTKFIGVSNFSCKNLADVLATAKIPPAVNQVCERENMSLGLSNNVVAPLSDPPKTLFLEDPSCTQ
uniref:Reductase 2 n=1 Tax=Solanum tuberosum TaxID=4113 RepID=M1C2G5_SOLTU